MVNSINRRQFIGVLGALFTAGCTGIANGNLAASNDPVEKGGIELAQVQREWMQNYHGASAVVYNNNTENKTVTVQFTGYDTGDNQLHQGTDSVLVAAADQAPVSKYWESDEADQSTLHRVDVEITRVE